MPTFEDTTNQVKASTEAIRENLAVLKELGTTQLKNNLDKNRQELKAFKGDVENVFQNVFKNIDRDFRRTLDFKSILQKGLNETSRQVQKVIQQSITQAVQQSLGRGGSSQNGFLGNLAAPISGLFKSSQGQLFAEATQALFKGKRNL